MTEESEVYDLLERVRSVLGITQGEMAAFVSLSVEDYLAAVETRDGIPDRVSSVADRLARGIAYATAYPTVADEVRWRLLVRGADIALAYLHELSVRGRTMPHTRQTIREVPDGTRLRSNTLLVKERRCLRIVDASERGIIGQNITFDMLHGAWLEEDDFG